MSFLSRMFSSGAEIQPDEYAGWRKDGRDHVLLDVRSPAEHATAWIDGDVHIPLQELPRRVAELEASKDKTIITYCHHGLRSLQAARLLANHGFKDVRSLAGGIDRWSLEIDERVPRY